MPVIPVNPDMPAPPAASVITVAPAITKEALDEIALSEAEYGLILDVLDREPNSVELGMFGALWSEHCGYKHSKRLLRFFPSNSPRVLSQSGAENAGAVDIGDGLAVVFKVESHNHPSAVEPMQGAATGVGGIVRDILAMGARPIALLNSLRFGPLSEPESRRLFQGVVNGISWYGNCIGVPDVGGEIYFDDSYAQNPLVNAMCVGLVSKRGWPQQRRARLATSCCWWAPARAGTAFTALPDWPRGPWTRNKNCVPPSRLAIRSWRKCSSRLAWRLWTRRKFWRYRTWGRPA